MYQTTPVAKVTPWPYALPKGRTPINADRFLRLDTYRPPKTCTLPFRKPCFTSPLQAPLYFSS
jgi:hypothetical protein